MKPVVRWLRSAGLARLLLFFLAAYSGIGAWLPWSRPEGGPPPPWAAPLGLDHPFSSPVFLGACGLLFASTLACIWGRRAGIRAALRGELPPAAVALAPRAGRDVGAFLRARGFRGDGALLFRQRWGIWGGWVLHVGLLVLIAGVLVQQSLHDGGAIELTEGETARFRDPGAIIGRERGVLAPAEPPDVQLTLESFDPFARQEGYAPDNLSRVLVGRAGRPARRVGLDRAEGIRLGAVTVYQGIPSGVSVLLQVPGLGRRSVHLHADGERQASARISDLAGRELRLVLRSERRLLDPRGTGPVELLLDRDGAGRALIPGDAIPFGKGEARVLGLARWASFTYSRSPGVSAVFAGFLLILAGGALLALPAGVARLAGSGENASALVHLSRGAEVMLQEWQREPPAAGE